MERTPKPLRQPYGGKYCCVVGCHNSTYRDVPRGIKFHLFPKEEERRKKWVRAVNRADPKRPSELWQPKYHDVVCSEHFVGGKKKDKEEDPAFVPSIFPTHQAR